MITRSIAAGALCALVLLSACTKTRGTSTGSNALLRVALPINPTQMNPILEQNAIENFIDGLVFDELVTVDDKGREVPDLAKTVPTLKNGGISKDGLTITYHLRPNLKWQDGAPLTSRDVKYTWQQVLNPKNNVVSHHGYDQVASIDTPDPLTVVMHMRRIFPPAIDTIFGESDLPYRILPEHLLAKYPSLNNVPFNAEPVGSGPYRFVRWLRNDRIELEANPAYFRGAPKISHLSLRIITDANTTESELRSNDVDLAMEVTGTTYANLADDSRVVRQLAAGPSWEGFLFNTQRAPLNDKAVRTAFALAVDKERILRNFGFGSSTLARADLTDFSWAYDASLQPVPFDLARAKATLDADGWRPGPDGIRVKNGQRLSLQMVYGQGSSFARNVVVALQQMLRPAGIELDLKSYTYQELYAAQQMGGILNSGKFDVTFYAWIQGADPDNSSSWMCSMVPPAGNNVSRYCSPAMDAAQQTALSTFDRSRRKEAYARIQSLLLQDSPGVFVLAQRLRYARVPDLQNFTPNGISEGWNAYEWNR